MILRCHFRGFMIKEGHPIHTDAILDHKSPKIPSANWRKCHEISIPPAFAVDGLEILYASVARTEREDVEKSESTAPHSRHEAPIG